MSLLVPFLMAVLLQEVLLVPSLEVLLVAVVASLESLLMALLVALVAVTDAPAGANWSPRWCLQWGHRRWCHWCVFSPCHRRWPHGWLCVSPTGPAGPLPAPSPPARLGALCGRWKHRAGGSDVAEVKLRRP